MDATGKRRGLQKSHVQRQHGNVPTMRQFFITGTDTGIGKTTITAGILRAAVRRGLRCAGMKPVASGADPGPDGLRSDDALQLIEAAGVDRDLYPLVNPYVFAEPIGPELAARRADSSIALAPLVEARDRLAAGRDLLLVEGVGGWAVPLSPTAMTADLARALGSPVLLVVGMRLGAISHALLTARAIEANGLPLAGWIDNRLDPGLPAIDDAAESIARRIAAPLLGRIDAGASAAAQFDRLLDALLAHG